MNTVSLCAELRFSQYFWDFGLSAYVANMEMFFFGGGGGAREGISAANRGNSEDIEKYFNL
mgnify:CR=1 FL=1